LTDCKLVDINKIRKNQAAAHHQCDELIAISNENFQIKSILLTLAGGRIFPTKEGNYLLPKIIPCDYFRGQFKDYGVLRASIFRDGHNDNLSMFIKRMKIQEFRSYIEKTNRVKSWIDANFKFKYTDQLHYSNGLYLDYESIAQHYGIKTNLIDFTNDFEIALFFACTRWDSTKKTYRKLEEEDLKESPYGTIYEWPTGLPNTSINSDGIHFMSIQPYMRSFTQSGFAVCDNGVSELNTIYKFHFLHDLKLSDEIFTKFDGGKKIFFDSETLDDIVDRINTSNCFSETAFNRTCTEFKLFKGERKKFKKNIESNGIEIGKNAYGVSDTQIGLIDKKWDCNDYFKKLGYYPIEIIDFRVGNDGSSKPILHDNIDAVLTLQKSLYIMLFRTL